MLFAFPLVVAQETWTSKNFAMIPASGAIVDNKQAEVILDSRINSGSGVALKAGIKSRVSQEDSGADLIFRIKAPVAGKYSMQTYAVTDKEGDTLMKKAKGKAGSLFCKVQIDDEPTIKRVIAVPWDRPNQKTGKLQLNGKEQSLKIWLPRGVRLGHITLTPYNPPAVPEPAQTYKPKILPPKSRPRLWVNQDSLPLIKARLQKGENSEIWQKVTELAKRTLPATTSTLNGFDSEFEEILQAKAFYYLITKETQTGKEAVRRMAEYLPELEPGNILDITREIGHAIYTGALVYDWCYELFTPQERELFRSNFIRLAEDMECSWPPFGQRIVNGHGGEAQMNRDLLSMAIAVYDEDPLPYQYLSYRVLEELVPMLKFLYQSPRHNQGIGYGAYRYRWELHAAWLFYRMSGKEVFDPNIKDVWKYWWYMRLPDGRMLDDGDGYTGGAFHGGFSYWKYQKTALLSYAYSSNPLEKAEFLRQGGLGDEPILFLLLNDPDLKPDNRRDTMPLTINFGPILGSMVARTGWDIEAESNDVVAEIKGGGYILGNHQHSDAGAMQIFYRGLQLGDLGTYKFYGTPYDMNFNKRSVAHSMMLVVDPKEKFLNTKANDGGTRFNQTAPQSPQQVRGTARFHNGKIISTSFGPDSQKPLFSYFSVNLKGAYSPKVDSYTRSFCFVNMERKDVPAVIILADDITSSDATFKKYWQINTFYKPQRTEDGFILRSHRDKLAGRTHVKMLYPIPEERQTLVLGGKKVHNVFGHQFQSPTPERSEIRGHRVLVSPRKAGERDRFLTVFQMTADDTAPLPVIHSTTPVSETVWIGDQVVSLSRDQKLIQKSFTIQLPPVKSVFKIALTGLAPGKWEASGQRLGVVLAEQVEAGENALFFETQGDQFTIRFIQKN